MKITIGGLKGGVGKTTSAGFLATLLAADGPTIAIDADPQSQSLFDWYSLAVEAGAVMPWDCEPITGPDLVRKVRALEGRYQHVVIDTGGETSAQFRRALEVCPDLLIPVRPNQIEVRRIPATFDAASEVEQERGVPVIPRILLVCTNPSANDGPAVREFFATGAVFGPDGEPVPLPVLEAEIRQSVIYPRQFGTVPRDLGDYPAVLAELRAEVPA